MDKHDYEGKYLWFYISDVYNQNPNGALMNNARIPKWNKKQEMNQETQNETKIAK